MTPQVLDKLAEGGNSEMEIVIVDDDPISLRIMRNILATAGYTRIVTLTSGREAIERIEHRLPDLVLLDIRMPDVEGYEVCRVLRNLSETVETPVLMVTGEGNESDEALERSFKAGANDFLTKPIRPIELLTRVRSALGIRTAHHRIREELGRRIRLEAEREKVIGQLRKALAEIRTLSGLLPICASCKKIRNDAGYWTQIESYICEHSEAEFSHSICPDCTRDYINQMEKEKSEHDSPNSDH